MSRAEATVNIEVKGALQGALEVRTLSKALDKLDRQGKKLSSGANTVQSVSQNLMTAGVKTRKVFDSVDKSMKMLGTGMSKFLGLALKSTILQFGLLSVALMGVHALFIAGKYLHKAYAWGMTAMAGAAASAAVVLGTAAAAIREQQAAMYAFTKGGAGEFVSGTNQVRNAMRTLQADSQLASLGVEAINKAYAAMAKSMKSSQIAQSGAMLKKLMDFGAAGQDPAAAADKVGALIEALNNSKTSMAGVKQAAKALGPQMEQALKKAKVTSKKQMKELIMSGELAKAGGVAGQFEAVNSTLISQAKAFFTQIKGEFADFGQQFLEPAKEAMQKIFRIIKTDLLRVNGALSEFGNSKFFDGLVTTFEKISNFFVNLLRKWLPETDGFFQNMGGAWEKFARWFRISKEQLRPFVEGARAVEGIFKPILSALKSGFLDAFKDFNRGAISNKETFAEIGQSLGSLITELFKLQAVFSKAFSDALPFLNDVIRGITQVVTMMTSLFSKLSGMMGGPMAYLGMMIMFRQMKGNTGGFLGKERAPVNTMTVTATNVNVNGRPVGGPGGGGPGGGGPGGPGGPGRPPGGPIPTGPRALGPGGQPLGAIGRGPLAIGPGSSDGRNLPMPYNQGSAMYDNQGRPLRGGVRALFDSRRGGAHSGLRNITYGTSNNPFAKLVGRGRNGRFTKLIPGSGVAGATGRVYEQIPTNSPVQPSYIGAPGVGGGALARTAGASDAAIQQVSGASGKKAERILAAQKRYQYFLSNPQGGTPAEIEQTRRFLERSGAPLAPPGAPTGGGSGGRFSSGATPPPGGGGGGGMPGPGGPGNAPPGAGGPGTQGAYSRRGFWGRISDASRRQAQGNTGLGQDLFRTKITGRQFARAEIDPTTGEYTGRVMNLSRKIDPITGNRITTGQGATYDPQTGFVSTKGQSFRNKMKYSGMTTRSMRNSALGSSILGNAEKGIGGINNSMGAKMGVGMGMGLASQYMPEEAQGAMAMGAMVGQFNPLAGLAVGLGGAALTSKTAGGGALTGAGAGAAIGTMIAPGIGTAVGAALGAITGAIAGFAGGMRQRAKESKAAMGAFLDGISTRQFQNAQESIVRQETDAAAGKDLSGRKGALEGVAGDIAGAYGRLDEKLKEGGFRGKYTAETSTQAKRGAIGGGLAGAGAGAAYGAALGSFLPGAGTLAGAGIGALIGGIAGSGIGGAVGGAWGAITGSTRRKQQNKDFDLLKEINNDPAFKGIISDAEMKSINKDKGAGLSKIGKELPDRLAAASEISDQQSKRMELLKKMSGKSGAELEVLAKKMGVNLYDAAAKTSDIVEKLGMTMVKTSEEMKNANIDTSVNEINNAFDDLITRVNAPKVYSERGRQVADVIRGGGDTGSVLEALKGFQESSLGMGTSPIDSFYGQMEQIGTLANPGKLFQEGGAWDDIDPSKFFTPEVTTALTAQAAETEKGFISNSTTQISSMMAKSGMYANENQMSTMIGSMSAPNKERFLRDVESGTFNITDPFANKSDAEAKKLYESKIDPTTGKKFASKEAYMSAEVNAKFASYGVVNPQLDFASIDKDTNAVADKMSTASDTFSTAVDTFNSNMANYFTDSAGKPEWWSKAAMEEIMGDTSTPRGGIVGDTTSSRLSQTMSRHNAINNGIPGKRTITSGYRTVGLGSLNSDHVTGRALDIVGQNLGSYAVATRNAGGFAEFHGSGDTRHLHAVPGPGAIGDTLMPRSNQQGVATSTSVKSGGSTFTFHINGGNNNPQEIANMVMAKIQNTEQKVRERR